MRDFLGLTIAESGKLYNYYHFREPFLTQKNDPMHRSVLDRSLHFFDTINDDIPKSSFHRKLILRMKSFILGWTLQYERGSGLVQLRSLKWLGMAFFHVPETNRYGSLYCGIGEENKDLPFML